MSFDKAYEEFLIYAAKRHKKQGFDTLSENSKLYVVPYFTGKALDNLNVNDFITWQDTIYDFNFSNNYNRNIFLAFHTFIKFCLLKGYLNVDYLLLIGPFKKKVEHHEHNIYTEKEFKAFRRSLDDEIYRTFFDLLFYYGLRSGEAMALKFSNLKDDKLSITSSMCRRGSRSIESVKTNNSNRVITLDFSMRLKIANLRELYFAKYGKVEDYFIFGGSKPLSPTSINRKKHLACLKSGIKEIKVHEFRHSCASRLISNGKDINDVSKLLGHSSVSITYDVYVHKKERATNTFHTLSENIKSVFLSIFTHKRKNL